MPTERIKRTLKDQKQFLEKKTGLFTRVGHHERSVDLAKKYQEALILAIDSLDSVWQGNTLGVRKRLCLDTIRRISEKIQTKVKSHDPEEE